MSQQSFRFLHTKRNETSANIVIGLLKPYFIKLQSILDIGCGMGTWGHAFELAGFNDITLVDHPSLPIKELVIENKSAFLPVDLNSGLPPEIFYDLIACIEVLEHFTENRALEIHEYICNNTDMVLFSAAIPGQNGVGHINCQRHAYWHQQFKSKGFDFYDGFKSDLIQNSQIHYWIRQNLFIYYRRERIRLFDGLQNLTTSEFELVHKSILNRKIGIKEYFNMLLKVLLRK